MSKYSKPFLTVDEQIAKLSDNGLVIKNHSHARALLRRVGYYRLSGYWYRFRVPHPTSTSLTSTRSSRFQPDISLGEVEKLYDFDRLLRTKTLEALEIVEVALRFRIGHTIGKTNAFAHLDPAALSTHFTNNNSPHRAINQAAWLDSGHANWIKELSKEENRSSETFMKHYRDKYGQPIPIWVVTEIMSFGTLTRLYSGLPESQKDRIASSFGVITNSGGGDGSTFSNWLNHLRYIRNTCAHYSRLWNKNLTVQAAPPSGIPELTHLYSERIRSRVYSTMAILAFLIEQISPGHPWRLEIATLAHELRVADTDTIEMGFPPHWRLLELWSPLYTPSHKNSGLKQDILDQLETIAHQDAGARLFGPHSSPKERRDGLRYARRNRKSLIGIKLAEMVEYPSFQFDETSQDIKPEVSEINQKLLHDVDRTQIEEASWQAADWWLRPQQGCAPISLVGTDSPEKLRSLDFNLPLS